MRELEPEHEEHWFERYFRIVRTGTPERFEDRADALGRWYDVYAFPVGTPEQRRVELIGEVQPGQRRRRIAGIRKGEFVRHARHAIERIVVEMPRPARRQPLARTSPTHPRWRNICFGETRGLPWQAIPTAT